MTFNESEKDKLDLLFKKTLGFNFTNSGLSVAQQNLTNYYINNSLIFSDPIPKRYDGVDGVLSTSSTLFDIDTGLSYEQVTTSGFTHVRKYNEITLKNVPNTIREGTGGSWEGNNESEKELLTRFIYNVQGNMSPTISISNDEIDISINIEDPTYKPIVNAGIIIFTGNSENNKITEDTTTIKLKDFFIYDGSFGLNNNITIEGSNDLIIKSDTVLRFMAITNHKFNSLNNQPYDAPANNTFFGYYSGLSLYDGHANIGIGNYSLYKNQSGDNNCGFGFYSLLNTEFGNFNTAVGNQTGTNIINGNNNVYIGYNANANGAYNSNEIVIGANLTGNGSNSVTIGNNQINSYHFNANTNSTLYSGNINCGAITCYTITSNAIGCGPITSVGDIDCGANSINCGSITCGTASSSSIHIITSRAINNSNEYDTTDTNEMNIFYNSVVSFSISDTIGTHGTRCFAFAFSGTSDAHGDNFNVNVYMNDNDHDKHHMVGKFENDNHRTGNINFTGQHRCIANKFLEGNLYYGLIVCAKKNKYINFNNELDITINENLPEVSLSEKENDKSVFGVISSGEDTNNSREYSMGRFTSVFYKTTSNENRMIINSLGEGGIWVSNKNGTLESGDYISSSSIKGYGQKQINNEGILCNFTVAKITCDCEFTLVKKPKKKIKMKDVIVYEKNIVKNSENNEEEEVTTEKKLKEFIYDNNGDLQFEDDLDASGNPIYEYIYDTRFLDSSANILSGQEEYLTRLNNNENVYIACFVGCTYHCG